MDSELSGVQSSLKPSNYLVFAQEMKKYLHAQLLIYYFALI